MSLDKLRFTDTLLVVHPNYVSLDDHKNARKTRTYKGHGSSAFDVEARLREEMATSRGYNPRDLHDSPLDTLKRVDLGEVYVLIVGASSLPEAEKLMNSRALRGNAVSCLYLPLQEDPLTKDSQTVHNRMLEQGKLGKLEAVATGSTVNAYVSGFLNTPHKEYVKQREAAKEQAA